MCTGDQSRGGGSGGGSPGYKKKCLLLWELVVSVVTPATQAF